jgi:hypothetical protein
VRTRLDDVLGDRGSDFIEEVSLSSEPRARLCINFYSEDSGWFIDSSEETSSSVSSSISTSDSMEESSLSPSSKSRILFFATATDSLTSSSLR